MFANFGDRYFFQVQEQSYLNFKELRKQYIQILLLWKYFSRIFSDKSPTFYPTK